MPTENLHITLAFLGRVDAGQFDAIVAAARGVRAQRFMLHLSEPGYWTHNHVAWLGATNVPEELKTMVADLRAALVRAGVGFDPKPFVPHVTLVRNARPPKEEWPTLNPVEWPVNGFTLVSSERDESGRYYRIAAGPFQAQP
jgi:2'-5' RNA ligase